MSEAVNFTVREMRLKDVDSVAEIERNSFSQPWTAESISSELRSNKYASYWVVVDHSMRDETVIAYGGYWLILDEAHITNIVVKKGKRRQGAGELLLLEMIRGALAEKAVRMTLEVRLSNTAAQALYKKKGFKVEGRRQRYYSDNNEDALIMWAELKRTELKPSE